MSVTATNDSTAARTAVGKSFRVAVLATAAVIALTALQVARQPRVRSWQTMWAEDGAVYGTDALGIPLWRTVARGYGGYVQIVPRLLALPGSVVPISSLAATFAVEAAAVTALIALFVYRSTEGWVEDWRLRVVVALMTALVPAAYLETNANLANLGWPLLIGAGWAIASRREGVIDVVCRCVVVAAAAVSTTLAVVFWPVSLVVARRRGGRDRVVFAALSSALALQFVLDVWADASARSTASSSIADLPQVFAVRIVGSVVWGERWLPELWPRWHYVAAGVACAVLALVVIASRRASTERFVFAGTSLGVAFALLAVPIWVRGSAPMRMTADHLNLVGSRYVVAPIVILVSAIVVLVDGSGRRWLRSVVVCHSLVLIVAGFAMVNPRSNATPWKTAVQNARAACVGRADSDTVGVPITPNPWTIQVQCDRLR